MDEFKIKCPKCGGQRLATLETLHGTCGISGFYIEAGELHHEDDGNGTDVAWDTGETDAATPYTCRTCGAGYTAAELAATLPKKLRAMLTPKPAKAAPPFVVIGGNAYAFAPNDADRVLYSAPVYADGRIPAFDPAAEWAQVDADRIDGEAREHCDTARRALVQLQPPVCDPVALARSYGGRTYEDDGAWYCTTPQGRGTSGATAHEAAQAFCEQFRL